MYNNFDALQYVAEGDSITAGIGVSMGGYPGYLATNTLKVYNLAVGGSTVDDLVLRESGVNAYNGTANETFTVLIGRNDITAPGYNRTTFLNTLSAYLDRVRATGKYVVLGTILPSNVNVGYNAERNTVNTTLRTWVGVHCDAIVDFGDTGTAMGADAAPSNLTLYSDGTHPTDAGQALLATELGNVFATIGVQ